MLGAGYVGSGTSVYCLVLAERFVLVTYYGVVKKGYHERLGFPQWVGYKKWIYYIIRALNEFRLVS